MFQGIDAILLVHSRCVGNCLVDFDSLASLTDLFYLMGFQQNGLFSNMQDTA